MSLRASNGGGRHVVLVWQDGLSYGVPWRALRMFGGPVSRIPYEPPPPGKAPLASSFDLKDPVPYSSPTPPASYSAELSFAVYLLKN